MEDDALCAAAQLDQRVKTKEVQVSVGIGQLSKAEAHAALVKAVIEKYGLTNIDLKTIRVDFPYGNQWPSAFSVEVEDYGN